MPIEDLKYDGNVTFTPVEDVFSYDRKQDRIGAWIDATMGNKAIEYVKPNPEIGLFELPEHTPHYSRYPTMTDVNLSVKSLEGTVPINKVGVYISKIANLEQDLRDVIYTTYSNKAPGFNPETEAFLESLLSKTFFSPRKIGAVGVEDLEGAIAATYHNDKTAVLVASKDMYAKARAIAESYGLRGEEAVKYAKRAIWYHELFHVADHRKLRSKRGKEVDVGEFLAAFFSERAKVVNEKTAGYYKAFAKENTKYADRHKNIIKYLAEKYALEAKAMGMDEEQANNYVSSRLEKEIEAEGRSAGNAMEKNENSKGRSAKSDEKCSKGAKENGEDAKRQEAAEKTGNQEAESSGEASTE
jgi:hypothetical protein